MMFVFLFCLKFWWYCESIEVRDLSRRPTLCACLFRSSSLSFLNATFENWFFNCFFVWIMMVKSIFHQFLWTQKIHTILSPLFPLSFFYFLVLLTFSFSRSYYFKLKSNANHTYIAETSINTGLIELKFLRYPEYRHFFPFKSVISFYDFIKLL